MFDEVNALADSFVSTGSPGAAPSSSRNSNSRSPSMFPKAASSSCTCGIRSRQPFIWPPSRTKIRVRSCSRKNASSRSMFGTRSSSMRS